MKMDIGGMRKKARKMEKRKVSNVSHNIFHVIHSFLFSLFPLLSLTHSLTLLHSLTHSLLQVLVVGNPANTNCLVAAEFAPSIPKSQFTCLTMLDLNRARAQIAAKVGVQSQQVKNAIIWGNHSSTQYPDVSHATVVNADGSSTPVYAAVQNDAYLQGEFIKVGLDREMRRVFWCIYVRVRESESEIK